MMNASSRSPIRTANTQMIYDDDEMLGGYSGTASKRRERANFKMTKGAMLSNKLVPKHRGHRPSQQ